jgi:hypothetical protein
MMPTTNPNATAHVMAINAQINSIPTRMAYPNNPALGCKLGLVGRLACCRNHRQKFARALYFVCFSNALFRDDQEAEMSLPNIVVPLVLYSSLVLSGCSIAMALNGHPEPNFEAFEVGSTRKQVEIQLGIPVSSVARSDGQREDTYRYEMGNSPNGARATLYFYYDLVSSAFRNQCLP